MGVRAAWARAWARARVWLCGRPARVLAVWLCGRDEHSGWRRTLSVYWGALWVFGSGTFGILEGHSRYTRGWLGILGGGALSVFWGEYRYGGALSVFVSDHPPVELAHVGDAHPAVVLPHGQQVLVLQVELLQVRQVLDRGGAGVSVELV